MPDTIESLELRRLWSATLSQTGLLSVTGTNGDDVIRLPWKTVLDIQTNGQLVETPHLTVMVNGVSQGDFVLSKVARVEVRLLNGNDLFDYGTQKLEKFRVTVAGGEGNDTIIGGRKPDRLDGGPGNDSLVGGAGSDVLISSEGSDTLVGGGGTDTANYAGRTAGLTLTEDGVANDGQAGETGQLTNDIETILGGSGADLISVAALTNPGLGRHIDGRNGRNTLLGGFGNDTLIGGAHNDSIRGGPGDDSLFGGNGRDKLYGDSGADTIQSRGDNIRDTVYSAGFDDFVDDDFMDIIR